MSFPWLTNADVPSAGSPGRTRYSYELHMADDQRKKEELEFTGAGAALGYISLDQARE